MKPLDPRLVKRASEVRWYIITLAAIALSSVLITVQIAWNLASFIVAVFVDGKSPGAVDHFLFAAIGWAFLRAVLHFAHEALGSLVSRSVKQRLRSEVLDRFDSGVENQGGGAWSHFLGSGLDVLDVYFAKFLPQLIFTAIVTPVFVGIFLVVDPSSALVLLFTIPLIPMFMILIGLVTRDAQRHQIASLELLNNHFSEVLRGIVTLRAFGRVDFQTGVLASVAQQHRKRTVKVLKLSFLSGFALELAASLSVALIAVTIGIRLIDGEMSLLTGLFVLLIAPEAYLPLRQVGSHFHASSDATSLTSRIFDLLDSKELGPPSGREIDIDRFTVLVGPSGSGKSLALAKLRNNSSWMPQRTNLLAGTVLQNITMFSQVDQAALERVVAIAHLQEVDLHQQVGDRTTLSGGEQQRVGLARALYQAFTSGRHTLILDEPLSQQSIDVVESAAASLERLSREGFRFLIATHQPALISRASQVVSLV